MQIDSTTEARFWAKVDKSSGEDGCWLWTAARSNRTGPSGYGSFRMSGKHWLAHRLAWAMDRGRDPGKLLVCHRCDNPPCCNPRHLFAGTHTDNARDSVAKDRHARGGRNGHAKLTRSAVLQLRRVLPRLPRGATDTNLASGVMRDLMRGYGVDQSVISRVVRGLSWRHV